MKVTVDKDTCVGCSLCASSCPDVYDMEGAVAVVKVGDVPAQLQECARQAAKECPVDAIRVAE